MAPVGKAIEKCSGQCFIAEDLLPAGEVQVSGDYQRSSLVTRGAESKQSFGTFFAERYKAQLIEDDQITLGQCRFQPA